VDLLRLEMLRTIFVLNEPEPEWTVVAHKRKKDRRSKEKEGNAADICGSAVASSAHKK
jgi:hypothetical protein